MARYIRSGGETIRIHGSMLASRTRREIIANLRKHLTDQTLTLTDYARGRAWEHGICNPELLQEVYDLPLAGEVIDYAEGPEVGRRCMLRAPGSKVCAVFDIDSGAIVTAYMAYIEAAEARASHYLFGRGIVTA